MSSSITVYFITCAVVVLTANISVGFGTFLAIVTPNLDGTVGLIGPTVLPMLIYSGFLINNKFVYFISKINLDKILLFSSIPDYFIWIKYISWIYYAYEAIMIQLWLIIF